MGLSKFIQETIEELTNTRKKENVPTMVTFEELSNIPLNACLRTYEGLEGERLAVESNDLHFRVHIGKGRKLPLHFHNCVEFILVLEGKMKEIISGRTLEKARVIEIPSFSTHSLIALEDTIFYMTFKTPNI